MRTCNTVNLHLRPPLTINHLSKNQNIPSRSLRASGKCPFTETISVKNLSKTKEQPPPLPPKKKSVGPVSVDADQPIMNPTSG